MDRHRSFFYGWTIVAVSGMGLFFSGGPIVVYSFGVFLKPLAENFHVGRGAVSLALTIHNFAGALGAPLVGWLVDRYGARKVIVPGLALFGAALLSATLIGTQLWQLYAFYLLLGVGVASGIVPYSAIIARWFDRRRGLALGLIVSAMGIGAAVVPWIAQRLIATFGWRTAFASVGTAILAVPVGVLFALLEDGPEKRGLAPDGAGTPFSVGGSATAAARQPLAANPVVPGMEWSAIWRTPTFAVLVCSFMLCGASVHACVLHLAALLSDRGLTPQAAALGSVAVGVAVMCGRLGSGYLQDRIFAPHVAMTVLGLGATGILMLWIGTGTATALTAAFFVGLAMGAEADIVGFLISRYFGLRAMGTAVAVAWGAFILAGGLGTLVMGAGFDATGSYALPLGGFFVAMLLAVALLSRLGPYRFGAVALSTTAPSLETAEV
jgi:MFS family permease